MTKPEGLRKLKSGSVGEPHLAIQCVGGRVDATIREGRERFRPVLHVSGMRPIPAQFRRESLPGMGHWAENSVSHRKTVTVQSLELVPVTFHPQNR